MKECKKEAMERKWEGMKKRSDREEGGREGEFADIPHAA